MVVGKKILFICPVFPPYKLWWWQSQVARDYAKWLSGKWHKITVLTTLFEWLKDYEKLNWIDVFRFSQISIFLLKCWLYNPKWFYRWLKSNLKQYDVVFIHDIYTLYWYIVAKLCKRCNIPYILMPHGVWNISKQKDKVLFKKVFVFLFSAFVSNNASSVIFCSENEKRDYEIPFKHWNVIKNWINQRWWINGLDEVTEDDICNFKNKYGLLNKKIIFSMWRLSYWKRFDKVINYLSSFLRKNTNYLLLIIWPDWWELGNLKTLIKNNKLNLNVKIIEWLFSKEKTIIFKIASLFILASDHEWFPIVVCEAISSKLPCLISNECNISWSQNFVEIFTNEREFWEWFNKLIWWKTEVNQEYINSFDVNNSVEKLNNLIEWIVSGIWNGYA